MKTLNKIFLYTMLAAPLLFTACGSDKPEESKEVAEEQNDDTFKEKADEKTAQWVVDVADANYYEIGLSKYAASQTPDKDVKDVAQMMISDHTSALNDLKTVAASNNISIPNEDTADINNRIKKLRDKEPGKFNKAYIDEMVNGHQDMADKLAKAADGGVNNTEVIGWANKTLPVVRTHIQHLTDVQNKLKAK